VYVLDNKSSNYEARKIIKEMAMCKLSNLNLMELKKLPLDEYYKLDALATAIMGKKPGAIFGLS